MSETHSTSCVRPINVLLIEDHPGDAELVRERLCGQIGGSFQIKILWSDTLESGCHALSKGGIDLVLLDLSLPDSQGIKTFRAVRSQAPQVPVVILTGLDDQALALQSLQEGGQDFLPKDQATSQILARMIFYAVERKRVETALLRSEDRYRILFETIPHAICVVFKGTEAFRCRQPGSRFELRLLIRRISEDEHA